jgi:hypothetical protein
MARRTTPAHYDIGKDIWIRARTNAFANEVATSAYSAYSNWIYGLATLFMVLPIGVVSYTYSIIRSSATPPQSGIFLALTLVTVVSNTLAVFLNIVSTKLGLSESAFRFKEQLALYSLIAQKARNLEHGNITQTDAMQLARYLQELFESTKARGLEPNNRYFTAGKKLIKGMNTYPFGLTMEDV